MVDKEEKHVPQDSSIRIPMDKELAERLIEIERRKVTTEEAKRHKSVVALVLLITGVIAFAVAVGALGGSWWFTCAIIGAALTAMGILLGMDR